MSSIALESGGSHKYAERKMKCKGRCRCACRVGNWLEYKI